METSKNLEPATNAPVEETKENVKEAARPVVERVATGAHHAVDNIAGAANDAVDAISAQSGKMKDLQDRLADDCREYVREHPLMAVGIAFATGVLFNRLFGGGSR